MRSAEQFSHAVSCKQEVFEIISFALSITDIVIKVSWRKVSFSVSCQITLSNEKAWTDSGKITTLLLQLWELLWGYAIMKDSIHVLINTCFQKSSLKGRWTGEEKMCDVLALEFGSSLVTLSLLLCLKLMQNSKCRLGLAFHIL